MLIAERIVMTPKKKTANSTSLSMERKRLHQPQTQVAGDTPDSRKTSIHVAGGVYTVICKRVELKTLRDKKTKNVLTKTSI